MSQNKIDMILGIIVSIIAILFAVGFSVWFIARTPTNLRKWYGIPVVIALIVLIVVVITLLFI